MEKLYVYDYVTKGFIDKFTPDEFVGQFEDAEFITYDLSLFDESIENFDYMIVPEGTDLKVQVPVPKNFFSNYEAYKNSFFDEHKDLYVNADDWSLMKGFGNNTFENNWYSMTWTYKEHT